MMKLLLRILLLLIPVLCAAQTVTVIDDVTLRPIRNVTITVGEHSVQTDSRGRAALGALADGAHITFTHPSYQESILSPAELESSGFTVRLRVRVFSDTVTITAANKREQDLRETPVRVTSISAEDVELENPQTAADLLGDTDEVFIQKSQLGGGSPMIRGFSTNRVLLVIDGVRMNNAIFREGNLQNVLSLDSAALENAEVTFGPGSTIYGSDAIGGVMSFNTIEPALAPHGETTFGGSGFVRTSSANDEFTGHLDFSVGGERWGSVTALTVSDFGDLRMGGDGRNDYLRREFVERRGGIDTVVSNPDPNLQTPSGYDQVNVMQKFRFAPAENWVLDYAFYLGESGDTPRYDRLTQRRNGALRYAEWYYGPQRWRMHALSGRYAGEETLFDAARIIIARQDYEESRHNRSFGNPVRTERTENVDAWSLNLDLDKSVADDATLYYGVEAVHNRVHSRGRNFNIVTGETAPESSRYPDGSTWASYAAYLQYSWNARDDLTLSAGGRYSFVSIDAKFDRTFFNFPFDAIVIDTGAPTASAGLAWRPAGEWQVNLNVSSGFRAPNIDDTGKVFDSAPGTVVVPNPDLSSEFNYSFDAGVIHYFGDRAQVEVSTFYSLLRDAMVRRDFSFNGEEFIVYDGVLNRVEAIVNADEASVGGVQAAFRADLTRDWSVRANVTWIEGSTQDGEALRHVPPPFGAVRLTWQAPRLRVEFGLLFNGEIPYDDLTPSERDKPEIYAIDENGFPFSPGWYTLNLKAQYQINEQLQLNAGLENILDRRYQSYSSSIAAPGRNLIVALRASF